MKTIIKLLAFLITSTLISLQTSNAQWVQTNQINDSIYCLVANQTIALAGSQSNGLFVSQNDGSTWSPVDSGLTNKRIVSVATIPNGSGGTDLFAGTWLGGLFRSTNMGTKWIAIDSGLANSSVMCLGASGNNLIAGTWGGGVFVSTNEGSSWKASDSGLTGSYITSLLAISNPAGGTNLFAGATAAISFDIPTYAVGMFVSTDNGSSWKTSGLKDTSISCLVAMGSNLFAGTYGVGVVTSNSKGANWKVVDSGLTAHSPYSLVVHGSDLYTGTWYGVFMSSNNGTSWRAVNEGLSNLNIYSIAACGDYLLAGTWGRGIWRRPFSEMTNVIERDNSIPHRFSLEQNYPNPFNPTTTIRFSLAQDEKATLEVFNILGQQIATLLSSELHAGTYIVPFNAKDITSGVYFYRLQAGQFIETKKLILQK